MVATVQILVVIKWNSTRRSKRTRLQALSGNFPTEGTPDSRGNCSISPSPHPGGIICSLHFTVGSFFQIYFLWCFFFFFSPAAFFSCKSILQLAEQQSNCFAGVPNTLQQGSISLQDSKPCRVNRTFPQRVAKGSTLITQLGAGRGTT